MRGFIHGIVLAAAALAAVAPGSAWAGNLAFGTTDGFESGSDQGEFYNNGGTVNVVASGTNSIPASGGSSYYAQIQPGAPNSYGTGLKDGPYAHIGASQAYPSGAGSQYSIFTDIYAASTTASSGSLWWTNGVNNVNTGDYLTETGFNITPGSSTWNFTTTAGGNPSIDLATGNWYTMEVTFDGSGTNVMATLDIFNQGDRTSGTPLYSFTQSSLFQNPLSSLLGGPRYSWFTVWNNNAIGSLAIDNIGSAGLTAVPEPSNLVMAACGAFSLLGVRFLRRRKEMLTAS